MQSTAELPETNLQYAKAIALSLFCNACWFFSFIYPNEHEVRGFESNLARGITFCSLGFVIGRKKEKTLDVKNRKTLINLTIRVTLTSIFAAIAGLSQFYLPLPIVYTICGSGPIFGFIVDYYLNGIRVNGRQIVGLSVGIIGLVLTVNGNFLMKWADPSFEVHTEFENYHTTNLLVMFGVALLLIFGNVLWAVAQIITKTLTQLDPYQITFHTGSMLIVNSAVAYCCLGHFKLTMVKLMLSVLFVGLPTFLSIVTGVMSIQMVRKAGVILIMSYSSIIMGYLMSIFYYHETQNPICIIGVVLIVAGVAKTVYEKDP